MPMIYPLTRHTLPAAAMMSALLLALAARPAAAAIDPAAQAVLQAALAASGGAAAWAALPGYRSHATVKTGGLSGTVDAETDAVRGAYRELVKLGPLTQGDGFDGTTAWTTDATGQPRIEQGGEARMNAINTAYRNRVAFFLPGRGAADIRLEPPQTEGTRILDPVRITPEGGRPFTLFIARDSKMVERMTEQQENDLITTRFSDFRKIAGVTMPYAITVSIGDAKYDQVIAVQSVEPAAIPPKSFAPPAPPAADFHFAGNSHSARIPFSLINNHIYLPVTIAGHTARMMFDTGAVNIIAAEAAPVFGITPQGALPGGGVGEKKQDIGFATIPAVTIGGFTMTGQSFATFPLADIARVEGIRPAGLVGYELARRAVVTIDYAAQQMTLTDPKTFVPPADAIAVPFVFNEHIPQVEGSIDGIDGKFDIDTGSRATLDILSPFAAAHGMDGKYKTGPEAITGWGVGGPARGKPARAQELRLGGVTLRDVPFEISAQKKGSFASPYVAGNVGSGLLRHFTLTLDYGHQRLYFQPNAEHGKLWTVDRSGMWLMLEPDFASARVLDVARGSAAAAAGVQVGDLITAADGVKIATLTLPSLRKRLAQAPGSEVQLTLQRQGKPLTLRLVLADRA